MDRVAVEKAVSTPSRRVRLAVERKLVGAEIVRADARPGADQLSPPVNPAK